MEISENAAAWKQQTRRRLLAERAAMAPAKCATASAQVCEAAAQLVRDRRPTCLGVYWPLPGELDLTPLFAPWKQQGVAVALPVVVAPGEPLGFRRWSPDVDLVASRFGVMEPLDGELLRPDLLLVPTLGFDPLHYRLGYGGGFYDRTLYGPLRGVPAFGISFAQARLETIHPEPWDVPLDGVLTEADSLKCCD